MISSILHLLPALRACHFSPRRGQPIDAWDQTMDDTQQTAAHGIRPRIAPAAYAERAAALPAEHPMFDIYSALALRERTQALLTPTEN